MVEQNISFPPEVSVIIVCMDRMDNLYPCLRSLYAQTHVPLDVRVVAYRFRPENLAQARADFPQVRWIESTQVRGFSENNNLALRDVASKYCFVLNDDTELRMPAIDALVADFGRLPERTAIVAPKLVNPDGSLQLCGRPDYPGWKYVLQQWHLYREPVDNGQGLFRTYNISGAAFLIRTEVFRELGWFDERYFFTPEDIALSTAARAAGFEVWCDAGVEVVHKWRTTASALAPALRPASIRGSLLFFSGGHAFRYLLLGAGVWAAEWAKRIKARLAGRKTEYLTYRNNTRSIFTRRSPKEIFKRYARLA
ncbi:MAG: glycosyltransferase [Bacteroidales bacterium]|nr:glycosyltransferase [Bacteroidales bacterium]